MSGYRIFIVEDDRAIASAVAALLKSWDMQPRCAENFRDILQEVREFDPHLILLDIKLPFFDGYHWCTELRKQSKLPILFLSSASDNMNAVMAMNLGADGFIAKPFDSAVLLARVQALLRRCYDFAPAAPVLTHRGATLDTGSQSLLVVGGTVELTKNEYRILLTLLESKGRVISREKLMQVLWDTDSFVDENTLTVNVGRLRKKLDAAGLANFITTKFGVGYLVQ